MATTFSWALTHLLPSTAWAPRGLADRCGVGLLDQAFDAYAALRYLSQLYSVDPARVASRADAEWLWSRFVGARIEESPLRVVVEPASHWSSAYLSARVPLARGWERQVDAAVNPQFYRPQQPG